MSYSLQLPGYSIGKDVYGKIDEVIAAYGCRAVVIGGKTAIEKTREAFEIAQADQDFVIEDWIVYGHNSTYANVDKLCSLESVRDAEVIFGVGGGRAIDTVKVVAARLGKPLFNFPTVGSSGRALPTACQRNAKSNCSPGAKN